MTPPGQSDVMVLCPACARLVHIHDDGLMVVHCVGQRPCVGSQRRPGDVYREMADRLAEVER